MKDLSIVTTLYKSERYIKEFLNRIAAAARSITENYEIIIVNDGSPDKALEISLGFQEIDHRILILDLSRNFGHHNAMMAGIREAKGSLVFLIDSDLEEPPETLSQFHLIMSRSTENLDVVYGVQEKRRGDIFERVSGEIFYRVFRALTGLNQDNNILTCRLMKSEYVAALKKYNEVDLNIGGVWVHAGFQQLAAPVNKARIRKSTYTLAHKIQTFSNAVTSFSEKPLRFVFYMGIALTTFAALIGSVALVWQLLTGAAPPGYSSIILAIFFFSGVICLAQGIVGIYLAKIFIEVKGRPQVIVKRRYSKENGDG